MTIRMTPYARSLAARIAGMSSISLREDGSGYEDGYLLRDWETRTTWMDVMDDVHEHYSILQ